MAIHITKYVRYVPWDDSGVGASRRGSANSLNRTVDLSQYYTKIDLQTAGLAQVHFDNITDAYHNNLLGLQGGKVITDSSGTPSSEGDDEFYHLDEETYTRVVTWEFLDSLIEESDGTIHLINDEDNPGSSKYYGTDLLGVKGWYDLSDYVFDMSLIEDSSGVVTLENDLTSPGNNYYYGTDSSGSKGWHELTKGFQTASFANPLNIDCTTYKDWICTITGDCTVNLNNVEDGDAGMLELIIDASGVDITFGAMWTKKMGPTDLDETDGADNIISWRAIGDGSTQEIVYTVGIIFDMSLIEDSSGEV